ncbi:MAG: T9SS type A sorting domain-containing protein [Bacteroidota bacterium]
MNKIHYYATATLLLLLSLAGNLFGGPHDLLLTSTTSGYPYINNIIMGDTAANGQRNDTLRTYVLRRGSNWVFNNVITNNGWALRIKAQDSSGVKPTISGYIAPGSTTIPIDFVNATGDVYLKNIVVDGIYELTKDTNYTKFYYGAPRELIVFNVNGNFTLVTDSCIFLQGYQADLRTFAQVRSFIVTNCIFANSGEEWVASLGNGRAVDIRNAPVDTVVMVNNTFVNGYDRVFRHIASVGSLNNFTFEHNTVINNCGTYGVIALGQLKGAKVKIRNNLLVDAMAFGADTNMNRQSDFLELGLEPFSAAVPTRINQVMIYNQRIDTISAPTFNIGYNYKYVTPAIQAVWNTVISNGWMPVQKEAPVLSNYIWSKVADSVNAFKTLSASPSFTNVPSPMAGLVTWYRTPVASGGAGGNSSGSYYVDFDRRNVLYFRDTMNCAYSTSSAAYTGTTDGFPAGDLNWFPTRHAAWLLTSVATQTTSTPNKFALSQNYPNPFNPSTQISYVLAATGSTTLKVYNIIGQEVATLVNGVETAGSHEVKFDASRLSSGVYFYSLRSGNSIATKKMLLMK